LAIHMSAPTTETIMLPIMRIPTFPPTGITTIPCTRVTTATAALATALAAVHALSKAVDRGLPRDRPNEDRQVEVIVP
jgi:hypothetical protein